MQSRNKPKLTKEESLSKIQSCQKRLELITKERAEKFNLSKVDELEIVPAEVDVSFSDSSEPEIEIDWETVHLLGGGDRGGAPLLPQPFKRVLDQSSRASLELFHFFSGRQVYQVVQHWCPLRRG